MSVLTLIIWPMSHFFEFGIVFERKNIYHWFFHYLLENQFFHKLNYKLHIFQKVNYYFLVLIPNYSPVYFCKATRYHKMPNLYLKDKFLFSTIFIEININTKLLSVAMYRPIFRLNDSSESEHKIFLVFWFHIQIFKCNCVLCHNLWPIKHFLLILPVFNQKLSFFKSLYGLVDR